VGPRHIISWATGASSAKSGAIELEKKARTQKRLQAIYATEATLPHVNDLLRTYRGSKEEIETMASRAELACQYNAAAFSGFFLRPTPSGTLVDDSIRAIPRRPAPPQAVVNALRGFKSVKFVSHGVTFILDKSGMKHILERHHPRFWNGTIRTKQSFFSKKALAQDIIDGIRQIINQNRAAMCKIINSGGTGQIIGSINGRIFVVGFRRFRINQFYPK